MKLLQHRSVQVFLIVTLYLVLAPTLPLDAHRGLYTFSLLMKDLLLWLLPLTVTCFIAHAIASFERQAPLFIITLFAFEALSNVASVWYSYGCGHLAASHMQSIAPQQLVDTFTPLWRLDIVKPTWWSADKGSLLGIALGLIAGLQFPLLSKWIGTGKQIAENILTKGFSRLIPLFILGFIARMYKTQLLNQMISQYADFVVWLVAILFTYIVLLFAIGNDFSWKKFVTSIKNLLPATGIAFSSGCSLSTMPWTIAGSSKNLHNPDLAKAVIPATTNIQQIGDCIINAFLCFLIYLQFNGHPPSLATWISFSTVFVLARYATAAVIGGAIFIMLPIYEHYLKFTPEMIAIILAFNVILDPLVTCSNVIANGALCRIFEKAWMRITSRKPMAENPPLK